MNSASPTPSLESSPSAPRLRTHLLRVAFLLLMGGWGWAVWESAALGLHLWKDEPFLFSFPLLATIVKWCVYAWCLLLVLCVPVQLFTMYDSHCKYGLGKTVAYAMLCTMQVNIWRQMLTYLSTECLDGLIMCFAVCVLFAGFCAYMEEKSMGALEEPQKASEVTGNPEDDRRPEADRPPSSAQKICFMVLRIAAAEVGLLLLLS